jgi:RHS repeat-associated protein
VAYFSEGARLPRWQSDEEPTEGSSRAPLKMKGGEQTGNFYYGARYYDPKISVWLSVDPWRNKYPYITPYNFVENNPLILVDPDGNGLGKAIVIGFVDAKAPIGKNDRYFGWLRRIGLNAEFPVNHAGIIIIDDETGSAKYYDFGRFGTPKGKGRVRQSNGPKSSGLYIADAELSEDGELLNLDEIMESILVSSTENGLSYFDENDYEEVQAGLVEDLDYEAMRDSIEEGSEDDGFNGEKGMSPFGLGSDQTVCATFVERVVQAGGYNLKGLTGGGLARSAGRSSGILFIGCTGIDGMDCQ